MYPHRTASFNNTNRSFRVAFRSAGHVIVIMTCTSVHLIGTSCSLLVIRKSEKQAKHAHIRMLVGRRMHASADKSRDNLTLLTNV